MTSPLPAIDPVEILARYRRDGVAVLHGFFDRSYSAEISEGWNDLKKEVELGGLGRNARFLYGKLPGRVGEIWRHPRLAELARSTLGPDVALYMNRLLLKDKEWSGAVAIHQDMPYFHGGQNKLSVFVPLQPVQATGGNGGLRFIVGSHLYGNLERGTIQLDRFEPMPELAPSLDVGDIVLMSMMTWHYSDDAPSKDDRPLLQLMYQPADDGSFAGPKMGVPEPTLLCGGWKTRHFTECRQCTIPDQ